MLETNHHHTSVANSVPEKSLELKDNWQFREVGSDQWYTASVPGNNFSDLLSNGLIKEPFYRAEENELQWIEKSDWEYCVDFNISKADLDFASIELIFDGLDTFADVYLNDILLLRTDNMFVQWKEDVKNALIIGINTLSVKIHSPITQGRHRALDTKLLYPAGNDHSDENLSVYCRKAPYHFGWDWGPRFVASGIWKPVWLKFYKKVNIEDLYIEQELFDHVAQLNAQFELTSEVEEPARLIVECLSDPIDVIDYHFLLRKGANPLSLEFSIHHYKKWWPRPFGTPYLYAFKFTIEVDGIAQASVVKKIGLRTIEVVNEPDEHGVSFYFKVNGSPLFIKGANYIPQDSFQDKVTGERYRQLYADVIAANMNMIRVWGGGIYEDDIFYDLADEQGILIWQDFMFACTMYPGDQDFLDSVEKEAIHNIKRLRNHPSLAIWCGNNEIEVGWKHWGWQEEFNYTPSQQEKLLKDYDRLFKKLLSEKVETLDPHRFYLSSSPISHFDDPEMFKIGDNHYWGVWHGEAPFEDFEKSVPRFMSEYGFQSFPLLRSVKKYSEASDWDLESEVMQLHQKHPRGNQLIKEYLLRDYKEPRDFAAFLYASQVLQAEGMKIGIEAHRRNRPFCMGTLYWQLNDCWPVASWSGIDYYGQWKALHYKVKDSYSDILVCGTIDKERVSVFVVSDLLQTQQGELIVEVCDFSGNKIFQHQQKLEIKGNTSQKVYNKQIEELLRQNDVTNHYLSLAVTVAGEVITRNSYYFESPRNLRLPTPNVKHKICQIDNHYHVELSADVLTKNLYLEFTGQMGNFSDNFFDLLPGETKTVTFPIAEEADNKQPTLGMFSLVDMYK